MPLIITINYFLYECIANECSEKLCIVCVLAQLGLNILLSILFGRIWGTFGVAIASVLSFIVGTLILMLGFLNKSCQLKLKRFFSFKYFFRSLKLSFFNASVFLFEALYIYIINWFILSRFNESYLSVFLIITNIINIVIALCDGVLMGMKPLVGIYYSENNPLAIKRVVKICLKILIVLAVAFSIFILIFARPLTLLIGAEDPSIIAESVFAIRIFCLSVLFSGLSSLYSSYLLFTGHAWYSILFSIIEFGICQILSPILFSLKNDNNYFSTSIIGIYANKNFVRTTNFNRCTFCVERAK